MLKRTYKLLRFIREELDEEVECYIGRDYAEISVCCCPNVFFILDSESLLTMTDRHRVTRDLIDMDEDGWKQKFKRHLYTRRFVKWNLNTRHVSVRSIDDDTRLMEIDNVTIPDDLIVTKGFSFSVSNGETQLEIRDVDIEDYIAAGGTSQVDVTAVVIDLTTNKVV
jgi:hypothetical protein